MALLANAHDSGVIVVIAAAAAAVDAIGHYRNKTVSNQRGTQHSRQCIQCIGQTEREREKVKWI